MKTLRIGPHNVILTASGSAPKKELLTAWSALPKNLEIKPRAIPKGHTGTTIAQDGIRITGNPDFITQVLSNLKSFISFEGQTGTRLAITCGEISDIKTGERIDGKYRVSIHIHSK